MLKSLKKIDAFGKNILIVFAGSSIVNIFNLLFQLLIAHRLSASDFASFNSLLSVYVIISAPLLTLQTAVAKYSSEFNAENNLEKTKLLVSGFFKKLSAIGFITFFILLFVSLRLIGPLKIQQVSCAYILALLVALSWLTALFMGTIQGLELFGWLVSSSVIAGALKLILAFFLVNLGYNISGGLGALLASTVIGLFILYLPLKRFLDFTVRKEDIKYKEIFYYLIPVAITNLCFTVLTTFDIVLVKYFFSPEDSGIYSLGQMVGKIFLFLPGAVSIVMFPKTSGLSAMKMDTAATLKRSLFYVSALCSTAFLVYNLFPQFILKVLTGKAYPESVSLGRLFGVSMSLFALSFLLSSYFLSIRELRFIKYLAAFTFLQVTGIIFFHSNLFAVQLFICVNSSILFLTGMLLIFNRKNK